MQRLSFLGAWSRPTRCKLATFLSAIAIGVTMPRLADGTEVKKPNIVIILADDLGYGDVQYLNPGRGKIPTPHLDRLASEGVSLTNAHSGSSVCTPTRYGLLTGRYAWRTRLQSGVLDGRNNEPLIAQERLTLASMLRDQGYRTACIGKWHLGFKSDLEPGADPTRTGIGSWGLPVGARTIGGPTTRGFDYFWGCSNARAMSSLIENDRVIDFVPPIDMMPRLTAKTVDYLAQAASDEAGRPFFLYVALTAPHSPILPTDRWLGKSGLSPYGDFVMQVDDSVGRVLAAIEQHGWKDNTLVFFSSDNGCAISAGVATMERDGHSVSAQYRGYKTDIWEGGHRVPFFARWPGVIPPGSRSNALFCLNDILATVAAFLGVDLDDDDAEDSENQWQVLLGEQQSGARDSLIHHSAGGYFAIRQGKWKLILCRGSGGSSFPKETDTVSMELPARQLYDLERDPGERINLYDKERDAADRLLALLQTDVERGRSNEGEPQTNDLAVSLDKP